MEGKVKQILYKKRFCAIASIAIKWCICTIVFATPFSKSLGEIGIVVAILLWAAKKIVTKDFKLRPTDLNIPLLAYAVLVLPSLYNSAYMALSFKAVFTKVFKYVALYFVITEEIDTKEKLKDIFFIGLLSAAIICIDGFIQFFYSVDALHAYPSFKYRYFYDTSGFYRGFPTACFPFPNDLSSWILLVLFPLVCLTIFDLRKNLVRYMTSIISIGLFILFFLAKVRSAWLALAVSFVYIAISKNKAWLVILLILMLLVPYMLKMEMTQYIFSFYTMEHRFSMWQTGWEIFKKHPVIGNGLNTFFEEFRANRSDIDKGKRGSYAHNCYLQMASDIGVVGLGAFLWVIAAYFISVTRRLKKISDPFYGSIFWGMSIGIFAFLVHAFFDTNLYSLNLVILFWTWLGISQSIGLVCAEREI